MVFPGYVVAFRDVTDGQTLQTLLEQSCNGRLVMGYTPTVRATADPMQNSQGEYDSPCGFSIQLVLRCVLRCQEGAQS